MTMNIRRSPIIVASLDNVPLTKRVAWTDCHLVPGEKYRLRAIIEGTTISDDKAALVCFEMPNLGAPGGEGLSMSTTVGPFTYLRTGAGMHRTDRVFKVNFPSSRFGVMAWGNRGEGMLRTLTIERIDAMPSTAFFFSFDVEAAEERAARNPIDTLVWGKLGGEEYGIRRLCEVLEGHGFKGNFLVDFATCTFEGESAARRIVEFLLERGHEVHMHLHPEWLARHWGLGIASGRSIYLDGAHYEMSKRMLDFTIAKYEEFVGEPPRLFRSGGYRINPHSILAAGALGIEALSNVRGEMLSDHTLAGDVVAEREPFVWENGVIEIPVDMSSPEAAKHENYLRRFESAMGRKTVERTFNLVMHSWSLIRRNKQGIHDAFEPEYEHRLQQICEHAKQHGQVYGYSDYLDTWRMPRAVAKIAHLSTADPEPLAYVPGEDVLTCAICDAVFSRARMKNDACPSCHLNRRHRQLKHVLDEFGNVFVGRSVLAYQMRPAARRAFLAGAARVVSVGPTPFFDLSSQLTRSDVDRIEAGSFDSVVWLDLLTEVDDPDRTISAIARALKPGGVFVSAAPLASDAESERMAYALNGYLDRLSKEFIVSAIPGIDFLTNTSARFYLAYKR